MCERPDGLPGQEAQSDGLMTALTEKNADLIFHPGQEAAGERNHRSIVVVKPPDNACTGRGSFLVDRAGSWSIMTLPAAPVTPASGALPEAVYKRVDEEK